MQDRAIAALLTHSRISDAAAHLKIAEGTLRAWLKIPDFQQAYEAARKEELDQTLAELRKASKTAVQALVRNCRCGVPAVEVSAAKGLLDLILKPAGVQVDGAQMPVKIEIVYQPQVTIDARTND
jgi:hypothetical protein